MANEKPFVVNKIEDCTCVGCGKVGRSTMIIPSAGVKAGESEWYICSKCLQWLKSKLQGF